MEQRTNPYGWSGLDRADHLRDDSDWLAECLRQSDTRIYPLWQNRSLFSDLGGSKPRAVTLTVDEFEVLRRFGGEPIFLGLHQGCACFAFDLGGLQDPDHEPGLAGRGSFADLRTVGMLLPHEEGALLAHARALTFWHLRHRFCGLCGAPTVMRRAGHQRQCSNENCQAPQFPRMDPAVIMLVHDGDDRCVLGRQSVWRAGMHSTLAGFVEPGEALEEAVAREVREEVGLEIREATYHSSQPWPFPSSLMLGFHARADYGSLRVQTEELESAKWFSRKELLSSPENDSFHLPRRDSISYRLIQDWLAGSAG
ncbi:MAG TPA: NAD(+) diphosphatase [Kiloniellales bacterium]|nr:NAD(+) diphosphatase [Kiloniellales bacterium]